MYAGAGDPYIKYVPDNGISQFGIRSSEMLVALYPVLGYDCSAVYRLMLSLYTAASASDWRRCTHAKAIWLGWPSGSPQTT
jgi:hypothetical protein